MASKMVRCKSCGNQISKSAKTCPYCGARNKKSKLPIIIGVIVVLLIFGLFSGGNNQSKKSDNSGSSTAALSSQTSAPKTYELSGDNLGKYGTVVTLNKDTDMPVDKNLYKLPAGKYKVTTTNEKLSTFFIVKDEVGIEEGNDDYPETLQYVGDNYALTAGNDDFGGRAKKEVIIEIAEDESILLPTNTDTIIVEESSQVSASADNGQQSLRDAMKDRFGNVLFTKNVRNDKTGRWRCFVYSSFEEPQEIASEYYKAYFDSDDEVHALINLGLKTSTNITAGGGKLFISVYEYVDGEEHDAVKMFTGTKLAQYIVDAETGAVEEL